MSKSGLPESEITKARARFEEMGANQVRAAAGQWDALTRVVAREWLSEKDHEAHLRNEASQSEQMAAASRAAEAAERAASAAERQAVAAERANTRATIALIIAITSVIATIIEAVFHR